MATAWDAAWSTSGGVLRGRTLGTVWLVGGMAFLAVMVAISAALHDANVLIELGTIGGIISQLGVPVLDRARCCPKRRLPWRAMVRPAIYGGIAMEALRAIGTNVVPALVRRSSTAYGTIGATFALAGVAALRRPRHRGRGDLRAVPVGAPPPGRRPPDRRARDGLSATD